MIMVVTGGAGFIGSRLASTLALQGHDVRVLDQFSRGDAPGVHVTADVRDTTALRAVMVGADTVFHLAGPVAGNVGLSPEEARICQLDGTRAVVEVATSLPSVPRIVLASSFYTYSGLSLPEVNEATQLDPNRMHAFGQIKYGAEQILDDSRLGFTQEMVIARIGSVYGPSDRCTNAVRDFCRSAARDRRIVVWGDPDRLNQFTHVDDIVAGLIACASAQSGIYNIVSPEVTTTVQLARLIADRTGAEVAFDREKASGLSVPYVRTDKIAALGWQARQLVDALPLVSISDGID